ncbi:hypothetical protein OH77DRAFT_1174552 [Trametes cingulata]|nr:hypothetical protein OH77DRAFT_1174552 [Trametes cingulata]
MDRARSSTRLWGQVDTLRAGSQADQGRFGGFVTFNELRIAYRSRRTRGAVTGRRSARNTTLTRVWDPNVALCVL